MRWLTVIDEGQLDEDQRTLESATQRIGIGGSIDVNMKVGKGARPAYARVVLAEVLRITKEVVFEDVFSVKNQ